MQARLIFRVAGVNPSTDPHDQDAALAFLEEQLKWKQLVQVLQKLAGPRLSAQPDYVLQDWKALERVMRRARQIAERDGRQGYTPPMEAVYKNTFYVALPSRPGRPLNDVYCELKQLLLRAGAVEVRLSMPSTAPESHVEVTGSPTVAAPDGTGADPLRAIDPGLTGEGQLIIDIERNWLVRAPAGMGLLPGLVAPNLPTTGSSGGTTDQDVAHGSAVASVILGSAAEPVVGGVAPRVGLLMAPCVAQVQLPSPAPVTVTVEHIADMLISAASHLLGPTGDGTGILLLEVTDASFNPIELDPDPLIWRGIRQAVDAHIVVIEPAGNGASDLGVLPTVVAGDAPDAVAQPSGALLVAAGCSGLDLWHGPRAERFPESNYGVSMDCWAWGDSIAALDIQPPAPDYRVMPVPRAFGGTSGAAAIIAGVVALMQQIARAELARPLTPEEVRRLLRDPALGTPGQGDLSGLGMPDLMKLSGAIRAMTPPPPPPAPVD